MNARLPKVLVQGGGQHRAVHGRQLRSRQESTRVAAGVAAGFANSPLFCRTGSPFLTQAEAARGLYAAVGNPTVRDLSEHSGPGNYRQLDVRQRADRTVARAEPDGCHDRDDRARGAEDAILEIG